MTEIVVTVTELITIDGKGRRQEGRAGENKFGKIILIVLNELEHMQ